MRNAVHCQCGCVICNDAANGYGMTEAEARCTELATQEDLLCDRCRPECNATHWDEELGLKAAAAQLVNWDGSLNS